MALTLFRVAARQRGSRRRSVSALRCRPSRSGGSAASRSSRVDDTASVMKALGPVYLTLDPRPRLAPCPDRRSGGLLEPSQLTFSGEAVKVLRLETSRSRDSVELESTQSL